MPRSGSQVLSSILNQHPDIYSTTTSPLADLLTLVNDRWHELSGAVLDPDPRQYPNIIKHLIHGAYEHINKDIVIDKNRLWPRFSNFIKNSLGETPKIICTVRNIPDILASYILLIEKNKNKITYIDQDLINNNLIINNKNRCKILWEKYINHPYNSLRIGVNAGHSDMLFVDYHDIVNNSQITLDRICQFIGTDTFVLDKNNLQPMNENDEYHGGLTGLHEVRPVLMKNSPNPEQVLGKDLLRYYQNMHLEFWKKYER